MARIDLIEASLHYPVFSVKARSLRNVIVAATTGGKLSKEVSNVVTVEALNDITFSVTEGDRLALLGLNGAGKTTLLKLMGGLLEPSAGHVIREGSLALMLGLLPSTDSDSTGLQNLYISGYARGLSDAEIEPMVDDIIEFSELGEFIDMPMRIYSSGMLARLIFSININMPADILLVDEVFGAGDATFVNKAQKRMEEFVDKSKLFIFSSHNETLIRSVCNKAALIDHGKLLAFGDIDSTLEQYQKIVMDAAN
jgi:ABC-2 type transport system ATP-binding protein